VQRILVIEDNPADVRLIHEALRDERSIELLHASLLEEGLERIEDGQDRSGPPRSLSSGQPPAAHRSRRTCSRSGAAIIVMSGADDER